MPKIVLRGEHRRAKQRDGPDEQSGGPINVRDTHTFSQSEKGLLILANRRQENSVCKFGFQKETLVSHLHVLFSLQGLSHGSPAVVQN